MKKINIGFTKSGAEKSKPGAAHDLRDLFVDQLKDIYWAEIALTKSLPKMIKNATADELVVALTNRLEVTREQVKQVEEIFSSIDEKVKTKKCDAMEGLIKEAGKIIENTAEGMVRDAGIISATQKVEHYEIASYGTLCSFARTLGEDNAAAILQKILDQVKEADAKLSEIAESFVNNDAVETAEVKDQN